MGIVEPRDVGEEKLRHVAAFDLIEALERAFVALPDDLLGLIEALFVHQLRHELVFDPLVPQCVGCGDVRRPCGLAAVREVTLVGREIDVLLQLVKDPGDARRDAVLVDGKDIVSRVNVAEGADIPVDVFSILAGEGRLIAGEEEQPLAVEIAHVIGNDLGVIAAVDGVAVVMGLLEQQHEGAGLGAERGRAGKFLVRAGQSGGGEQRQQKRSETEAPKIRETNHGRLRRVKSEIVS